MILLITGQKCIESLYGFPELNFINFLSALLIPNFFVTLKFIVSRYVLFWCTDRNFIVLDEVYCLQNELMCTSQ